MDETVDQLSAAAPPPPHKTHILRESGRGPVPQPCGPKSVTGLVVAGKIIARETKAFITRAFDKSQSQHDFWPGCAVSPFKCLSRRPTRFPDPFLPVIGSTVISVYHHIIGLSCMHVHPAETLAEARPPLGTAEGHLLYITSAMWHIYMRPNSFLLRPINVADLLYVLHKAVGIKRTLPTSSLVIRSWL